MTMDGYTIAVADEFEYVDPVDGSVSSHQGAYRTHTYIHT